MVVPKKRLLHVEDDLDFLSYVKLILEDIAYIDQAMTLEQAHELLEKNTYDLLLLDIDLPDGSGMTIVDEFRSIHSTIPIVVFSVHSITDSNNNISKAFQKGFFSERSLVETIKTLTGGAR